MDPGVQIESQTYRLNQKDALRESLRATYRKHWLLLSLEFVCGAGLLAWGYKETDPTFAVLGLMIIALVPTPVIRIFLNFRKRDPAYDNLLKLTISGGQITLGDDVGNSRTKPLSLLAKVESKGSYLHFTFSDRRVFAVPLSAFSKDQLVEIQELVASLEAQRQKVSSAP